MLTGAIKFLLKYLYTITGMILMSRTSLITETNGLILIGWREWVSLPDLGIPRIKAKIDTGARTSALHAFALEPFKENGKSRIRFQIHPRQRDDQTIITCEADVCDERTVTDSGGHKELRYVIKTPIVLGKLRWMIEITLTNRDTMGFRMLLGRTAMHHRLTVNPSRSFLMKKGLHK
jgi:hypothetical protein